MDWTHAGPTVLASFLASLVEGVEALTVVLAVGAVRGWRGALGGSAAALLLLLLLTAVLGPALTRIPLHDVQLAVGALLLMFGLRWLRKAILRSAGVLALRDEDAIYSAQASALRAGGRTARGWDGVALATAFKITLLEGIEIVFIVVALGAAGGGLLLAASLGASAALLAVIVLGLLLHRPVARIPENALKTVVGILLSAFGAFWAGEGAGFAWPGADWSILGLIVFFALIALAGTYAARSGRAA